MDIVGLRSSIQNIMSHFDWLKAVTAPSISETEHPLPAATPSNIKPIKKIKFIDFTNNFHFAIVSLTTHIKSGR
jgi:hypothetical protein